MGAPNSVVQINDTKLIVIENCQNKIFKAIDTKYCCYSFHDNFQRVCLSHRFLVTVVI